MGKIQHMKPSCCPNLEEIGSITNFLQFFPWLFDSTSELRACNDRRIYQKLIHNIVKYLNCHSLSAFFCAHDSAPVVIFELLFWMLVTL